MDLFLDRKLLVIRTERSVLSSNSDQDQPLRSTDEGLTTSTGSDNGIPASDISSDTAVQPMKDSDGKPSSDRSPSSASAATMGRGAGLNLRNLRTFSSLKNGQFRLYYGAMLGQMAAMNMQMIVRSLLIFRLTGSAADLGILALANASPMLLLSLFGGVLADRVAKKQVLIAGQAVSGILTLAVAICLSMATTTRRTN